MGHPVYSVSGYDRALFGRGQVILRDPATGVLTAGSDPRADGCAMTTLRYVRSFDLASSIPGSR